MLAFVNELERPIGTYLYGAGCKRAMVFCESVITRADQSAVIREFVEIWLAGKIVYSRTLRTVSSARTRVERDFDSDAIRRLKETSGSDITIGGAELAGTEPNSSSSPTRAARSRHAPFRNQAHRRPAE